MIATRAEKGRRTKTSLSIAVSDALPADRLPVPELRRTHHREIPGDIDSQDRERLQPALQKHLREARCTAQGREVDRGYAGDAEPGLEEERMCMFGSAERSPGRCRDRSRRPYPHREIVADLQGSIGFAILLSTVPP
ncbi:MAG: hypothetical protein QMC96_06155 [Methanomicrobiales archaeon]|nr:hypothetical protein [Methanomicrobiales archaeon]